MAKHLTLRSCNNKNARTNDIYSGIFVYLISKNVKLHGTNFDWHNYIVPYQI